MLEEGIDIKKKKKREKDRGGRALGRRDGREGGEGGGLQIYITSSRHIMFFVKPRSECKETKYPGI